MKPVQQDKFGYPHGNCFQACIASILELPLEDVPHFCDGDNPSWKTDTQAFLQRFGLFLLTVSLPDDFDDPAFDDAWCVLSGPGPRGHRHSVVGHGRKVVHDPHPDGTGLLSIEECDLFITLDPSRRRLPCEPA